MVNFRKLVLPFLGSMAIIGCMNINTERRDSVQKKEQIKPDSLKNYKVLKIDTSNCPGYFYRRAPFETYENSIALITMRHSSSKDTVIKCNKQVLYVCNLPDFPKTIGDTIYITGTSYQIRGDERPPGHPTFLTKLLFKGD